jgi:maleate isomerase
MRKIGLIVPSSNTTMEPEFNRVASGCATIHSARIRLQRVTPYELEAMEKETSRAALELSDAAVDVICYGCTSGSLFRGLGHDRQIASKIEEETGIPAVVTAGAVIEALRALGAKRLSVATPYIREIEVLEKKFLEDNGFEITSITSLGLANNLDIGSQSPEIAYTLAKKACTDTSDAVFISCTNLKTIDVIGKTEVELNKAVVSSNTATIWKALRVLDIKNRYADYGRLLG